MNPDPDYSAAYVVLHTDGTHEGHGLTFTIGRGNEICVAAIHALRDRVVGLDLEWIGVLFQLKLAERAILMTINEKIAKEILAKSPELLKKSMVPSKRLRSLTGRLAWAAGVVPRTRWTRDPDLEQIEKLFSRG